MKGTAVLLLFCLALPVVPVSQGSSPPQNDWALLRAVAPGSSLQVKSRAGKTLSGDLERVTDSALELRVGGKTSTIPASDVARVYILRGRPVGKGTLIGIAVGGGAGAGIGAIAGANDNWFGPGIWIATMSAAGVLAGGLVGMAIGSKQRKELIYESAGRR